MRRVLGRRRGIASSLGSLGNVACERGDYRSARGRYAESLAIFGKLDDRWDIAASIFELANI